MYWLLSDEKNARFLAEDSRVFLFLNVKVNMAVAAHVSARRLDAFECRTENSSGIDRLWSYFDSCFCLE